MTGHDAAPAVAAGLNLLCDRYLHASGTWIDPFDAKEQPLGSTVPTSTL